MSVNQVDPTNAPAANPTAGSSGAVIYGTLGLESDLVEPTKDRFKTEYVQTFFPNGSMRIPDKVRKLPISLVHSLEASCRGFIVVGGTALLYQSWNLSR